MQIKLDWPAITTHKSGRPVAPGDIAHYQVAMQVDGAPSFTVLAAVQPDVLTFSLDVADAGTYHFEVRGVDQRGSAGDAATGSIVIADTSGLSAPASLTVSLV